jgi:iron(III) transport system ATP-binding protein
MAEALSCRDVEVRFGTTIAVAGASLEVAPGEILALLGRSGCGKTTLLRSIAGLERTTRGEIQIGQDTVESPARFVPAHRRSVGLVFQDYALFPHLTVAQNITYGLRDKSAAAERLTHLLALGGLEGLAERYPHQLSGGQQQRVAILRSLAPRPRLLLLDEPFSNLDAGLRVTMREQVAALLRAEGVTAVLVTHDRADALSVADRVAVMASGRILEVAAPDDLYFRPATAEAAALTGDVQFIDGVVREGSVQTALGVLPAAGPVMDGPCTVLIRPEWLLAVKGGAPATVVRSRLEGSVHRARLILEEGISLVMVVPAGTPAPTGLTEIGVALPVPTFPRV